MAAEVFRADPPSRTWAQQPLADEELLDDGPSELRRAAGRMKAFAVEPPGDLSGRGPRSPQLDHAIAQDLIIAELFILINGTTNLVPALLAACPADRHVDHSVCPRIPTVIRSTRNRTIVLRSSIVVLGAFHNPARSSAHASIRWRLAAVGLEARQP